MTNGEILHGFIWGSLGLLRKWSPNKDPSEWLGVACYM